MKIATLSPLFLFFCFTSTLILQSWAMSMDEVMHKRIEDARRATSEAYNPNPVEITSHFNTHVHRFMQGNENLTNNDRRNLMGKVGEKCQATNPIDACWRCQHNWAENRYRLADCALGFGHKAIGGKYGKLYVVTDNSDDDCVEPKPGTLRHAVIQQEPLWITFSRNMNIKLKQELIIYCNKTLDGRGVDVHIAYGAGIMLQNVQNVIIHGLHIHHIIPKEGGTIRSAFDHFGLRTPSDGDGISIFNSSHIWLDHLSMSQCTDGIIDVIQGSTAITVSNSHFTKHNDVMLFGAHENNKDDMKMQVTIAFNHFGQGLIQRMPRGRWGFFHVVNNDYTHWNMYAIGGSSNPTIISQGNRFVAPDDPHAKEVTKHEVQPYHEWKNWVWRSDGDLFMNGAFFNQSGDPTAIFGDFHGQADQTPMRPVQFISALTKYAGALYCYVGKEC